MATYEEPRVTEEAEKLFDLSGKNAIVTGASRGIGRALAVGLARYGANVACMARSADGLKETVSQIDAIGKGKSLAVPVDLRAEDTIRDAVESVATEFGGIDILVNNAADDHEGSVADTDLATWQRVMELNLQSCFLLCREAGPHLRQGDGGRVVNVASILASVAMRDNAAYIAAKSGLVGFTRALSLEWARDGVQVNALAPGFVRTVMTTAAWDNEAGNKSIIRKTPQGRWGEVTDMVGPTVYLASSASGFMTGQVLNVDGGWTVQ